MFSSIFDLELALYYDIPTYSVKIQTLPITTGTSLRSVVSVLSVVTSYTRHILFCHGLIGTMHKYLRASKQVTKKAQLTVIYSVYKLMHCYNN